MDPGGMRDRIGRKRDTGQMGKSLGIPDRQEREQDPAVMLEELRARVAELEHELERTQRLATIGTLMGSIAHEFNNILTPVMSYAQLAQQTPDDHALVTKALQKAVDGTEKAAQIAAALLGFIRDDETDLVTHVGAAIQDCLACVGREPRKDGIDLVVEAPTDCWVRIRPVALQQVLMNLLLNAWEVVPGGSGQIRIKAECSTWNQPGPRGLSRERGGRPEWVRITVSDNGSGMAPELVKKLFQPFVRGKRAPGGRRGTGLGLAICKRLIQEAGGTLEVESTLGHGTTFTVMLPATSPVAEQKAA